MIDILFHIPQVATPRVRTAAKAEIPHLDDHVSKLHAVGNMTQNKLQDINSAAIAVGVYNINVPYNTVTKGAFWTSHFPIFRLFHLHGYGLLLNKNPEDTLHHHGKFGMEDQVKQRCLFVAHVGYLQYCYTTHSPVSHVMH